MLKILKALQKIIAFLETIDLGLPMDLFRMIQTQPRNWYLVKRTTSNGTVSNAYNE